MLDLDAIFNPEEAPAVRRAGTAPATGVPFNPSDLPGKWWVDWWVDWWVAWDERAAIMEYDGGLPRERAEALALKDIMEQMERAGIDTRQYLG